MFLIAKYIRKEKNIMEKYGKKDCVNQNKTLLMEMHNTVRMIKNHMKKINSYKIFN